MKKPTTALAKQPSSLFFGKEEIRVEGEMVCLTDMWKAGGSDASRRPNDWMGSAQARDLLELLEISTTGISGSLVRTSEGRHGGTFAHWHLAMAYGKYLSPAFHVWCNEVVRDHMEGVRGIRRAVSGTSLAAERLELQRAKLEHEKKKLAAKMLADFSANLRATNQNELAQTVDVKAIEFMTGDKFTFALPANTTVDWQSPTQIAESIGATPNLVGRVISSLNLRGDIAGTCRPLLSTAKEGTKTVPVFVYSPEAVKQITTAVRARMAPKAS